MAERGVLLLRLEGPLQSWGERSRWDVRDTALRPTRSGVLGMIATARGWGRGDPRFLKLQNAFSFGVRVDRAGSVLVDFHTVEGVLPSADGARKGTPANPYTIVSRRSYLQDASFLVGLEASMDEVKECEHALRFPRWPYYLGRKSCPPSVPVVEGCLRMKTLVEALSTDIAATIFIEDAEGPCRVADRSLGTPARDYVYTRYRQERSGDVS